MAKVIVDSDAIFALYNPTDPLNAKARKVYSELLDRKVEFIYPSSVVFEILSLLQRVLKSTEILELFFDAINEDTNVVFQIEHDTFLDTLKLFNPRGSNKNSIVDCSVVAVAKKMKADGIFSFDEFYVKQGLKLARDLID